MLAKNSQAFVFCRDYGVILRLSAVELPLQTVKKGIFFQLKKICRNLLKILRNSVDISYGGIYNKFIGKV